MPFFSIIVPVYNVEKYLAQCIKSITEQNFKDYELILIDDGSKDTSGDICDSFARENQLIVVSHQQNAGLGFARNAGLDIAKGEWILFLDSDDFLSPCLSELKLRILSHQEEQMFVCRWRRMFVDVQDNVSYEYEIGPREEIRHQYSNLKETLNSYNNEYYGFSVWKAVIRRSDIEHYGLRFKVDGYVEDLLWDISLFQSIHSFFSLDLVLVNYRYRKTGTLTEMSGENLLRILDRLSLQLMLIESENNIGNQAAIEEVLASEFYKYFCKAVDYDIIRESWCKYLEGNRRFLPKAKQPAALTMYRISKISCIMTWYLWRWRHILKKETPID